MKLKTLFIYDKVKLNRLVLRIAIEELTILSEDYKTVADTRRKLIQKAKKQYK